MNGRSEWRPDVDRAEGSKTAAILDALRRDILHGVLRPSQRIPSLRVIATAAGVNAATVKRAFDQAEAEGLIERHVGRGTYVRAAPAGVRLPFSAADELYDLATNSPPALEDKVLRRSLTDCFAPSDLRQLFRYHHEAQYALHLEAIRDWIALHGIEVSPDNLVVTPGAQAAIVAALLVSVGPGAAIAVDELTYAGFVSACRSLGVRLVPVPSDDDGMSPDLLERRVLESRSIVGMFAMPRAHNPTTRSMSRARLHALAEVAERCNLAIIEDDSYIGPRIRDDAPCFLHICPSRTFYLSGFSKTLQPGLRIGYLIPPHDSVAKAKAIAQSLNYSISPLLLELVRLWIRDGSAIEIYRRNIAYFRRRHAMAAAHLSTQDLARDPRNAQIWLTLPSGWTSRSFSEALRARNVLISPGESFQAIQSPLRKEQVRLCVGAIEDDDRFAEALQVVASVYADLPEHRYHP